MKYKTADPWLELAQKVEFLQNPTSYPDRPPFVEWVETHMSWVFLTDQYAYKLKKPVEFNYLNLASVDKRKENAQLEVSLNQALAPDLYLDFIPLKLNLQQELTLKNDHPSEKVVDWLVLMKRFPQARTLEYLLDQIHLTDPLLAKVSRMLSDFYLTADVGHLTGEEYCQRLRASIHQNYSALSQLHYGMDFHLVKEIHGTQLDLFEKLESLLIQRVEQKKIIEGHGDLRPEHICLVDPPIIIDRLEFSRDLRTLDPLDELSYLTLECAFLGRPEIGDVFLKTYLATTHDKAEEELLAFYRSHRACLRAKLCLWHLDDIRVADKEKYLSRGRIYLNLARAALTESEGIVVRAQPPSHRPVNASSP